MRGLLAALFFLATSTAMAGDRVMILTPSHALTDSERADLARRGVMILEPLAGGRHLARVTQDTADPTLAPLTAEMKIHPSARVSSRLNIVFRRDVSFDHARQALLSAGASLDDPLATTFLPLKRLRARLNPASLTALAADDLILTVLGTTAFRIENDNQLAAQFSHVTELHSAPHSLSGEGVVVATFEGGMARASHPEFGGRLTIHGNGPNSLVADHTTHVAGTIGAVGLSALARGMAPKVRIHQFCLARTTNFCTSDWLVDKDRELAPLGVIADNNSWSFRLGWSVERGEAVWNGATEKYGSYDPLLTAPLDEISTSRNVLFIHSAGNDGNASVPVEAFNGHRHVDENGDVIRDKMFCYSSSDGSGCPTSCNGGCETIRHATAYPFDVMSVTASAKNVIAVGALNGSQIADFSSRGPAKDGRVKPDLVAKGAFTTSTTGVSGYGTMSGTSMSTPVVTGIAAILTEQWRRTFDGANPTPAQLKALLLAGAEDLGNPGPDFTYGFGLVNAKSSVDMILADDGVGKRIRSLDVAQGEVHETTFVVPYPQRVRVLLAWSDPAVLFLGTDAMTMKALVNDLDVIVIDPLGREIHPYVLDKAQWNANATTGINTVDNAELLEIESAAAGTYRIRVTGTAIVEGPQRAVLVTSAEMVVPHGVRRRAVR